MNVLFKSPLWSHVELLWIATKCGDRKYGRKVFVKTKSFSRWHQEKGPKTKYYSYIQNGDLGQVLQCLPLPLDVLHTAHDHDVLQFVVVEVGGSERHHEVAEANERTVGVSEQTDNDVTVEDSHGSLVTVLDRTNFRSKFFRINEMLHPPECNHLSVWRASSGTSPCCRTSSPWPQSQSPWPGRQQCQHQTCCSWSALTAWLSA